jgi:hypothetical protein
MPLINKSEIPPGSKKSSPKPISTKLPKAKKAKK